MRLGGAGSVGFRDPVSALFTLVSYLSAGARANFCPPVGVVAPVGEVTPLSWDESVDGYDFTCAGAVFADTSLVLVGSLDDVGDVTPLPIPFNPYPVAPIVALCLVDVFDFPASVLDLPFLDFFFPFLSCFASKSNLFFSMQRVLYAR